MKHEFYDELNEIKLVRPTLDTNAIGKQDFALKDLKRLNPMEQMLIFKLMESRGTDTKNLELLESLESQNKIIEGLSSKVQGYQNFQPTESADYLRQKIKKVEKKLFKQDQDDRKFDETLDLFVYNLQSTLMTLPFMKQKQKMEEIQYRQTNDYVAQLKAANSLMNTFAQGRPMRNHQHDLHYHHPSHSHSHHRNHNPKFHSAYTNQRLTQAGVAHNNDREMKNIEQNSRKTGKTIYQDSMMPHSKKDSPELSTNINPYLWTSRQQ